MPHLRPVHVAVVAAVLLAGSTGGAVAGGLITSAQIKDHTITAADIHAGVIPPAARAWGAESDTALSVPSLLCGSTHWLTLLSKKVTTPKGFLTITGTVQEKDTTGDTWGWMFTMLNVDGKQVSSDAYAHYHQVADGDAFQGVETLTTPVRAGTHTVKLQLESDAGTVGARQLTIVYTPQGSGTSIPVSAANNPCE